MTATDLRHMTPTARTLWWYMIATGHEQEVITIAETSGIPLSSVYMAAAKYPQWFALTGSLVRHTPSVRPAAPLHQGP